MADAIEVRDLNDDEQPVRKGMKLPILLGLIVGIIIVQVGIVMAAIKYFAPASHDAKTKGANEKTVDAKHGEGEDPEATEAEQSKPGYSQKVEGIVTTKNDLYINPRGSSTHIVVVSLGIEISPEEKQEEVAKKLLVPIQDRVISRISSYTVEELQNGKVRDSLRTIIKEDIKPFFRGMAEEGKEGVKLRNVYFPKFIIQ